METAASMGDWMAVLDRIEASVGRALAEVEGQERALDAADAVARADLATAEEQTLAQIDNHLAALQGRLRAAATAAEQVDALVTHDAAAVAAWRASAQRLAALTGRGVG
jgi:hypothetical protein